MYSETMQMTDWMTLDDDFNLETHDEWKISELDATPEHILEQSTTGRYNALSEDETAQLEAISAGRLKVVKQETVEYRKPSRFSGNIFPSIATSIMYTAIGALAIGAVVAIFAGTPGINFNGNPSANHVARTSDTSHQKVVAPHRYNRVAAAATYAGRAVGSFAKSSPAIALPATPSAPAASAADAEPIPEYKGPSAVTGVTVSHRRAYQTSNVSATAQ